MATIACAVPPGRNRKETKHQLILLHSQLRTLFCIFRGCGFDLGFGLTVAGMLSVVVGGLTYPTPKYFLLN